MAVLINEIAGGWGRRCGGQRFEMFAVDWGG